MGRTDAAPSPTLLLMREQPADIARLDRDRSLRRVRPGVYVPTDEWAVLEPWERYALRVDAVGRTWSDPVFCLESAAPSHGLPVFGEPRFIHVLSADGSSWREGDVIVHGSRDERRVVSIDGRTVTGTRDTTVDLCRVLPPAFALAVADAALRLTPRGAEPLDVSALGRAQQNRRGLRQLDWVQAHACALAETPGESVSRAVIGWLGYAEPEPQREFRYEGWLDRTDFYWPCARLLGESDGWGKYDADDHKAMKAHFVAEKRREDRLRRHEAGMVRWEWSDAMRWTRLDDKLRLGGVPRVRPRQTARLATLADNPRSFTPAELRGREAAASARPRPVRRDRGLRAKPGTSLSVSR